MQQNREEMARWLSEDPGFLMIGSNEAWVQDRQAVLSQTSDEVAERSPRLVEGDITAMADGQIGWAADQPTLVLPNGSEVKFRYTCVMHRSEGRWRIVQSHLSASVSDDQLFGAA